MKLAIKGHATRGKEAIEILEMLGGKNQAYLAGIDDDLMYYICTDGYIDTLYAFPSKSYKMFTLEEFLEKYPYKVGDKVLVKPYVGARKICEMRWDNDDNYIKYGIGVGEWFNVSQLQPYKEQETMNKVSKAVFDSNAQCCDIMNHLIKGEKIKLDIPEGYEFFGVDDENKVVFVPKQNKYPKTYTECCAIVGDKFGDNDVIGYRCVLLT